MMKVKNLIKVYNPETIPVHAVNGISFEIEKGDFVAIIGASGSGKSTLLHMLGLLDLPTKGEYTINNLNIVKLPEEEKTLYRLLQIGYVFQEYALVEEMTALGNVSIPLIMQGKSKKEAEKLAKEALDIVGLRGMYNRTEDQLSGGERQRVAIARAIVAKPKILFADEPCANLDSKTSEQVLEVFKKLNHELKLTIIMVTHEEWHIKYADRVIKLRDGVIEYDKRKNH
ncbi:MAG: ABC transporter ATP-binding protein [Candidatus Nanoarchaeia archaeon]|nr:ABC transporter ATP-binding protein [Candidatus Nanoarchaeia archaeon]MDD5588003.1 ABC transporter ATP-binding protein [Candidatus Nanoarchaeia archaeon]